MDYKVIIILLALLFLIVLVYREVSSLKDQFGKNISSMTLQFRQNSDKMMTKFQNNMNKYVSQIKGISSDNLQQLRKITLLNHQQVTRPANHFTETDNSEVKTDVQYLSDTKGHNPQNKQRLNEKNNKIFEKKEEPQYYMSEEDTKKTKESDMISEGAEKSSRLNINKKPQTIVCDDTKCYIQNTNIDNTVNVLNQDSAINNNPSNYNENENENDNDNDNNNENDNDNENDNENDKIDNEILPIYQCNEDPDKIPVYLSNRKLDTVSIKNMTIEQKNNIIIPEEYEDIEYESENENANDDMNNNDLSDLKVDVSRYNIEFSTTKRQETNLIGISKPTNLENSIIDDDGEDNGCSSEERVTIPIISLNYNDSKNKDEIEIDVHHMRLRNIGSLELSKIRLDDIYIKDDDLPIMEDKIASKIKKDTSEKPAEVCSEDTFNVERNVRNIDLSESINNMMNDSKNLESKPENVIIVKEPEVLISLDDQIKQVKNKKNMEIKSDRTVKASINTDSTNIDTKSINMDQNNKVVNILEPSKIELKKYEDYSFNELKFLSKKLQIPTHYREKNKTKQYKKEELYENIKTFLNPK